MKLQTYIIDIGDITHGSNDVNDVIILNIGKCDVNYNNIEIIDVTVMSSSSKLIIVTSIIITMV